MAPSRNGDGDGEGVKRPQCEWALVDAGQNAATVGDRKIPGVPHVSTAVAIDREPSKARH